MAKFKDIEFHPYEGGVAGQITFDNGYGASVICHRFSYGGKEGKYELAVIKAPDWELCYDTPITSDVQGWLSKAGVTNLLKKIEELPNVEG